MGPTTTRYNKKGQSFDGVWGSKVISITQSGYLHFHYGPKPDHRLLWIKIQHSVSFGYTITNFRAPSARKLRIHHPIGQRKYTSKIRNISWEYDILPILRNLEQAQTSPPSLVAIKYYEDINILLMKAIKEAKYKVRCLHMSFVQYLRTIYLAQLRICLSNLIINVRMKRSIEN